MKAHIHEIEIEMASPEQETLKRAADITGYDIPEYPNGYQQPTTIRHWQNVVNHALNEDIEQSTRIELLQLRKDLSEVLSGIDNAENRFDNAY